MFINIWINGKLMGTGASLSTAKFLAAYLKGKGWTIKEMYEIGTLALFGGREVK